MRVEASFNKETGEYSLRFYGMSLGKVLAMCNALKSHNTTAAVEIRMAFMRGIENNPGLKMLKDLL